MGDFIVSLVDIPDNIYVSYRLIPPEKGKYQLGLWGALIQHLVSESTPSGIISALRSPPDFAITFSKDGLILSFPEFIEDRVVTVLGRQSLDNRLFVYERIGNKFKRPVIRWVSRSMPSIVKDYQEVTFPVEKQVEKQAVNDPTEAIGKRFAEFVVQKGT